MVQHTAILTMADQ